MGIPVLCTYSKMLFQEHFEVAPSLDLKLRDSVVIETRRGVEVGRVAALPGSTRLRRDEGIVGKVVRRATQEDIDIERNARLRVTAIEPLKEARAMVIEANLPMRFVDTEETIDKQKIIFYFVSEARVDFRELVRKMAARFNKRIELRQIGARDVARLTGDVDNCGEELCCKSFLIDFVPVSMKMAKNQGLALDSGKVSGICGRLKCCLKYEDDIYSELRKTVPRHGQPLTVDGEEGWAAGVNTLTQTVNVQFNDRREEVHASKVTFDPNMSERDIRTWQREMREARRIEAEQRAAAREARKAGRMGGAHGQFAPNKDGRRGGAPDGRPAGAQQTDSAPRADTPAQAAAAAPERGDAAAPASVPVPEQRPVQAASNQQQRPGRIRIDRGQGNQPQQGQGPRDTQQPPAPINDRSQRGDRRTPDDRRSQRRDAPEIDRRADAPADRRESQLQPAVASGNATEAAQIAPAEKAAPAGTAPAFASPALETPREPETPRQPEPPASQSQPPMPGGAEQ